LKLLKDLPRLAGNPHLFPGNSKLGRLSENTLNQVIKRKRPATMDFLH
jgi:hypothetical protein